jgi:uncharacterized membrane protein YsdA (DUF1294 family)
MVTYELAIDERQKVFATKVTFVGTSVLYLWASNGTTNAAALALLFLAFVGVSVFSGRLPLAVLIIYAVFSSLAFALYGSDKFAAKNDRWRIPESALHLLDLLGGWPGALVAQMFFRHKSRKLLFQLKFWTIVFLNCAVLGWIFSDPGFSALRTLLGHARMHNLFKFLKIFKDNVLR